MELTQFKTVEQLAVAIKTLDMVTAVPWTDYSGTSTIVGWTSYTEKIIEYKKIGKLVFCNFRIAGESDNVAASFTLPFNEGMAGPPIFWCRSVDDGNAAVAAFGQITGSSPAVITLYSTAASGAWTASGSKSVYGQFWYEAA